MGFFKDCYEWYRQFPALTRTMMLSMFSFAILTTYQIISPYSLLLYFEKVFAKF